MAERASGSPRPANERQSLSNLNSLPEPSYNKAGYNSDSDIEFSNTESDKDNKELYPI